MSNHTATITWERNGADFLGKRFSRVHTWQFDGGTTVAASASPHVVPEPYTDAAAVDPEEAFVAALSSCHMLTFLYLAAEQGFVVEGYQDQATGTLGKNDRGRLAITKVALSPVVRYGAARLATAAEDQQLHQRAHETCFLANAVSCALTVSPTANTTMNAEINTAT